MINLLPWRAQLRRKQRQTLIALLIGASFTAIVLLGLSHLGLVNILKTNQQAYDQLQAQKSQLEKTIRDYQTQQQHYLPLLQGILLLQQCATIQTNLLKLLYTLPTVIPNSAYLTQLLQTDQQWVLIGIARKHQTITQLMQGLEGLAGVKQATLLQSQHQTAPQGAHFKIEVSLAP
jgi:type IV pilus assembly protein PilN